jgi:uncharacterized membrane protein
MVIDNYFTKQEQADIRSAVKEAELNTSGEIRVHIEKKLKGDVLDRAAYIFETLNMHKTKERNGVLFYLALESHKYAILGDVGINAKVPENFWDSIKEKIAENFKNGNFTQGLTTGIVLAGEQLKKHFPHEKDDINELTDEISFGPK